MSGRASICSVVIPARDDADALRRCLAAVAAQQDPPDEVIVVDNGSRDGSAVLAEHAGARIVREQRTGIASAASAGYDAARGEVILRLDADSRPPEDRVAAVRRIAFDRSLVVPVSGRPLVHPVGLIRRARRASHTLALHAAPPISDPRWAAAPDPSRRPG